MVSSKPTVVSLGSVVNDLPVKQLQEQIFDQINWMVGYDCPHLKLKVGARQDNLRGIDIWLETTGEKSDLSDDILHLLKITITQFIAQLNNVQNPDFPL